MDRNLKSRNLSTATRVVILTAFYFVGGILGKDSTFMKGTVSLVWPASGIALAAILLFGYSFLPGVLAGAVLVSYLYVFPGAFALGSAVGSAAGAVVCTFLLHRFGRFQNSMHRVEDVVSLIVYGAAMGTTVNAAFNALSLCAAGVEKWDQFYSLLLTWWIPNGMAALVVTPFILAWATSGPLQFKKSRVLEIGLWFIGLITGTLISFNSWYVYGVQSYPFAYLPYPFLVWGALRFGQRGATSGTMVVSAIAIHSLLHGRGPFVMPTERDSLMLIGSYLGVLAASNLLLAAAGAERRASEIALQEARDTALESSRLKSEFLANMSHEIRTPMNGVIGMTGLLMESPLSKSQREFVDTIRECGDSLLTIINDILDFSKIEAGMMRFENLTFDLSTAVEGTVELIAEQFHKKKLELISYIDPDVPIFLRGDPGRLRQVLINLVGNAAKFTDEGEVVVRVTRISETAQDVRLRFEIADTGIGISEEGQKRLFQAFSQGDGSTTRRHGGTGLGLVISKKLVLMMKGEIGVESAPGKGSTFWFTAGFEKSRSEEIVRQPPRTELKGVKALIVDDNETNRKVLHYQLSAMGVVNDLAESGPEAIAKLDEAAARQENFDIVVLDYQMPAMDGLDVARAIRKVPGHQGTRILMMSSISQWFNSDDLKAAGVDICLTKPVKQSLVLESLSSLAPSGAGAPRVAKPEAAPVPEPPAQPAPRRKARILVAEDNIVNQKVSVRQVQKLGYSVDAVANGLEVLDAARRIEYDVILMDCQMPEMDGYDATMELRKSEAGRRHTIIIALTAHAMEGDREKCLAAGMDDYISKPVKTDDLRSILERWTSQIPSSETS